jgi:hypothetical protein
MAAGKFNNKGTEFRPSHQRDEQLVKMLARHVGNPKVRQINLCRTPHAPREADLPLRPHAEREGYVRFADSYPISSSNRSMAALSRSLVS